MGSKTYCAKTPSWSPIYTWYLFITGTQTVWPLLPLKLLTLKGGTMWIVIKTANTPKMKQEAVTAVLTVTFHLSLVKFHAHTKVGSRLNGQPTCMTPEARMFNT